MKLKRFAVLLLAAALTVTSCSGLLSVNAASLGEAPSAASNEPPAEIWSIALAICAAGILVCAILLLTKDLFYAGKHTKKKKE